MILEWGSSVHILSSSWMMASILELLLVSAYSNNSFVAVALLLLLSLPLCCNLEEGGVVCSICDRVLVNACPVDDCFDTNIILDELIHVIQIGHSPSLQRDDESLVPPLLLLRFRPPFKPAVLSHALPLVPLFNASVRHVRQKMCAHGVTAKSPHFGRSRHMGHSSSRLSLEGTAWDNAWAILSA